jgi:hypothetical protein
MPAPVWTIEDRDNWKRFLGSPTGRKLFQRLSAFEAANCIDACRQRTNTHYAAASAGGYSDAVRHIISLSWAADDQAAKTDSGAPGEAPTAERESDDYLVRNSP